MDLTKEIKKIRPDIKESSVKKYVYDINKLKEYIGLGDLTIPVRNRPAYILKRIKLEKDFHRRKSLLNGALMFSKIIKGKRSEKLYKEYLRTLNDEYKLSHFTQEKSEKDTKNMISYEELVAVKDREDLVPWFKLFLELFFKHPIRNCFCSVSLEDTKDNNFITRGETGYTLTLRKYKTSDRYGEMVYDIQEKNLVKFLDNHLRYRDDKKYLFENRKGAPFTSAAFTNRVMREMRKYYPNKRIGTTTLRKILITNDLQNLPSLKQLELDRIEHSKKYLHDLSLAQLIYRKP